ncbi:MAG TPA: tRNA-dihydrouridine synthase family protein [Verrucomicrobiae bacterium]|jgi:nifR3 family TIM-barrel protein
MNPPDQFLALLKGPSPMLSLAPMQDVTNLAFWRVIAKYGGADVYWTEYFRSHGDSRPEQWILDSITQNPTGRPIVAQMIGNDVGSLTRTARELQRYPIAAIDLNLGCPAPVVYRKCAGGGLLREPQKIDAILGALRDTVTIPLTVKTRVGFDSTEHFDDLLALFSKHSIQLLTVHGRTVTQMYRPGVRYDLIARAASVMRCPVLANGDIHSAKQALEVLSITAVAGLMIGRGVIRNPWLFEQIRNLRDKRYQDFPTGGNVFDYICELWESQVTPEAREMAQVQRLKKFMNFIGEGIIPSAQFLHDIRRATTKDEFFRICKDHLDHDRPMPLEPQGPAVESPEAVC